MDLGKTPSENLKKLVREALYPPTPGGVVFAGREICCSLFHYSFINRVLRQRNNHKKKTKPRISNSKRLTG